MERLKFINEQMGVIAVPYEFGQWSSDVKYPYVIGELTEESPYTEDGRESSTMLLTVFHRGKYLDMETVREKIKSHFCPVYGLRGTTDSGSTVVVFYDTAFYVPTGDADLKKMQINLKIYLWKGAI